MSKPTRDDGYFPKGTSVLRQVQEERAVGLLYGQRALLIGAGHPVNFTGTFMSTKSVDMPWQRLAHTGKVFERIFFGTREEADRALAFVDSLHQQVKGEIPEDMGRWPAGTRYSAYDPELMLWTIAVMMDSAEVIYETLVDRLTAEERERLWREYVTFGELFGMPGSEAPQSYAEFREYWRHRLSPGEFFLTPDARKVATQVAFRIPLPGYLLPNRAMHNLVLLGTVPPEVREHYGFGWSGAQEAAFRATVALARTMGRVMPGPVRHGYNTSSFELVARTERRLVQRGKGAMDVPPVPGKVAG